MNVVLRKKLRNGFLNFYRNHTRLCQVFLMKEKNESGKKIQDFCNMIEKKTNFIQKSIS